MKRFSILSSAAFIVSSILFIICAGLEFFGSVGGAKSILFALGNLALIAGTIMNIIKST